MMPNLRARIKAVADKPKPVNVSCECQVIETRTPISEFDGLLQVCAQGVHRLGLDHDGWDVRRALFLDTETTGLRGAGTVAFLVGLGWIEGDAFVVRQLLMRDYPEETHQLTMVADIMDRFDTVVSFNGKSFDLPLLRDRFTMARLRDRWRDLPQLDLLHTARRTWKLRLGTCTLGHLEESVLGIHREGDLPGAEVPERFFQYLKCGDFSLLEDVLRHNEQDIRTLGVLLARLSAMYGAPEEQQSMLDIFSMGRALQRQGEGEMARRCFQVTSISQLSKQARLELAQSHRRDKNWADVVATYQGLIARGEADEQVYTALAIVLERYLQDPRAALEITEKALWRYAGGGLTKSDPQMLASLERRRVRLKHKLAKSS